MARRLPNRGSKKDIEAPEFITPYSAPAPSIGGVKLSLILLVLTAVRLVVLIIICLPWSIHNLKVIYHPRAGVRRQLYWPTALKLEPLFMPVQFSGGYNTDRFREVVSYIYIVDCFLEVIIAPLVFLLINLRTIMVLCIVWLIWGIGSLGVFSWGFARFVIRKQFPMIIYYLDFAFIFLATVFILIQIISISSLTKVGYITLPTTSRRSFRRQNMVVPKKQPEVKKAVSMKDDKDLVEVFGGDSGPNTPIPSQTPTTPVTTTTSVEPTSESAIATPNAAQDQQGYGNYDPYYGAYGQYPPPPYGAYPPPGYPGPNGYPPNYQQQQQPQQQQPQQPTSQTQDTLSTQPTPQPQLTKAEPTPEPSRAASVVPSTANPTTTTTTTELSISIPRQQQQQQQHPPHIVSVGPNPYELQAMLERLMPRAERPTNTTLTEISISRKKRKRDKKKKKKKSKHKKRR